MRALVVATALLTVVSANATGQTAPQCDFAQSDAAMTAYRRGEAAEAIRLATPLAGACRAAPYVLFYAHQRLRDMAGFRRIAEPLADRGDPEFAFYVAQDLRDRLFIDERSAAANLDRTLRYLEVAHRGRNGLASQQLGEFYFFGRFRSRDITYPRRSLERAEEYFQSCRYNSTVGRDCTEALAQTWLRQNGKNLSALALLDSANALEALWAIREYGLFRVTRDTSAARLIEARMARLPESRDESNTISIKFFLADLSRARTGNAEALRDVAERFNDEDVLGIPDDGPTFVALSLRAVRLGDGWAAHQLGEAYANGQVARRDLVTGYMYFSIALDRGSEELQRQARRRLEALASEMSPEEIREAQRLTREFYASAPRVP